MHCLHGWDRDWLLGWRDIARASDVRTFVPSALPLAAAGDTFLLAFPAEPAHAPLLQAVWSSLVFDYISRQKLSGTHMKYFIVKQLACPEPAAFDALPAWSDAPLAAFVRPRVLELAYTSSSDGTVRRRRRRGRARRDRSRAALPVAARAPGAAAGRARRGDAAPLRARPRRRRARSRLVLRCAQVRGARPRRVRHQAARARRVRRDGRSRRDRVAVPQPARPAARSRAATPGA